MITQFIVYLLLVNLFVLYFTPKIFVWSLTNFVYLLANYYLLNVQSITITSIYATIVVIAYIRPIRLMLTKIIYNIMRKALPKISETEQLALNAGDSWYETEVFRGKPNYELLHGIKKFSLTSEEQSFLDNETNILCNMLDDWHITHTDRDLPIEVWNYIRHNKFFGLVIAKEYGGLGFSASAHSDIVMRIATKSATAAVTVMVPNSLGPGELLFHYGTQAQKEYYLPRLARGEEVPCFALTGPTAGSDATSIPDEGIVVIENYQGQETLGIRLNNIDKRYITLAPVATLVGLAFKLSDPNLLLKGIGRDGITCVLLPHSHPEVEIGNRLYPLNQAFMNGIVRIKSTFIPIDWIIGGQKMAGEGWRMLVECLAIGRSVSLPACGTANALLATVTTSAYAMVREQFKVPIGAFEGVGGIIARMGGLAYLMNATRQFTVMALDCGKKPSVASAIAKYHLTEMGREVVNHAMDIHAGKGIIMGPNNYIAQAYQSIPIGITVEGANIMTRNLIIFGQGAMRSHPYVRTEYEALGNYSSKAIAEFDTAIYTHIGYSIHSFIRAIFHGFTRGLFAKGYKSQLNNYYKQISKLSSAFATISDLSLVLLAGDIKRKERISARLGDAMSYLYMACSTVKYFKDEGERVSDINFVKWSLEYCLYIAENSLFEVLNNYPAKVVGKILKFLIFPYGKIHKNPNDSLEYQVGKSLLDNSQTRKAFRKMCYQAENDAISQLEDAFNYVLSSKTIKAKIYKAIKDGILIKETINKALPKALAKNIITLEEFNQIMATNDLINKVIQVDEFKPYELGPKNCII